MSALKIVRKPKKVVEHPPSPPATLAGFPIEIDDTMKPDVIKMAPDTWLKLATRERKV